MERETKLTQCHTGHSVMPIRVGHVERLAERSLMKKGETDLQKTTNCSKMAEMAERETLPEKMSTVVGKGNQNRHESEMIIEKKSMGLVGSDELNNDMDHAQKHNETKVVERGKIGKIKRWKSQARNRIMKEGRNNRPTSLKRPIEV